MSGLGSVVVGYRPGNRRVQELQDRFGLHTVAVRRCIAGCGYPVHFYSGGVDAAREKDSEVMCDVCYEHYRDQVVAEL